MLEGWQFFSQLEDQRYLHTLLVTAIHTIVELYCIENIKDGLIPGRLLPCQPPRPILL